MTPSISGLKKSSRIHANDLYNEGLNILAIVYGDT